MKAIIHWRNRITGERGSSDKISVQDAPTQIATWNKEFPDISRSIEYVGERDMWIEWGMIEAGHGR